LDDGKTFSYTMENFVGVGVGGDDDVLVKQKKPKFLFLHGGPGSHRDWRFLSGALKEIHDELPWLDIPSVIRVDLPGHGKSSRAESADAQNMVELTMRGLKSNSVEGPWVLVGHSLGGHAALEASVLPEVVGCGFLAPVSLSVHKGIRPHTVTKWLAAQTERNEVTKRMTELVYKKVLGFPARHEKEEFCWTMNRAASLDFRRARDIVKKFEKVRNEGAMEGRKYPSPKDSPPPSSALLARLCQ
jgi:pimeloyl-ACP methyl ester carboxylesterase